MIILDCETLDSTIKSISDIYRVTTLDIDGFLNEFDLSEYLINYDGDSCPEPESEILRIFEDELSVQANKLDHVCWFHLTRTSPDADFKQGILPLTKSIDIVWENIIQIFKDTHHAIRLIEMRKNGVNDFQYDCKNGKALHAGPFGLLVKESAFRSKEMGNHNYLKIPEIIEDICNGYKKKYNEDIQGYIESVLVPEIVKFRSDKYLSKGLIASAIYYLYFKTKGSDFFEEIKRMGYISGREFNCCFDGKNSLIDSDQILSVEIVAL